jgi:transcriptional regulator with PAS, ATPase and Fis domain
MQFQDSDFHDVCGADIGPIQLEQQMEMLKSLEFLGMVLDNVYSGIIVCDRSCRILFMNKVYGELLKTDPKQAIGKHIKEYFPHSRLAGVLISGTPELGQRCSLKTDAVLLVNRIPLKRDNEIIGVILQTIFRDYKDFTDLVNRINSLERKVKYQEQALESLFSPKHSLDSIVGETKIINDVKNLARKFAGVDSPVLILGPTGSGKELFAHGVHASSDVASGPLVCVNCAAIPKDLMESELFGYEGGAFTGAQKKGKPGQIELADKGTLYLDEVGELPLSAQAKLLRVVEEKTLVRLGGVRSVEVNFRLIAATNRDLREMSRTGQFREDLFFRLNTLTLTIPPLAQRPTDVRLLVSSFLDARGRPDCLVQPEALEALENYQWPGNVRELKNVVDRALSLVDGSSIKLEHLPTEILGLSCGPQEVSGTLDRSLSEEVARFEKTIIAKAVHLTKGNMSKAAKMLSISRSALYEKFRKHHITPPVE